MNYYINKTIRAGFGLTKIAEEVRDIFEKMIGEL